MGDGRASSALCRSRMFPSPPQLDLSVTVVLEQTRHWLSWLARQMKQRNQTVFYLEHLQPDWLPNERLYELYRRIVLRLIYGLPFGLICGAFGWLADGLLGVLMCGVVLGLVSGLIGGRISKMGTEIKPVEIVVWSWRNIWRNVITFLSTGLIFGLGIGLIVDLYTHSAVYSLQAGLYAGLIVGPPGVIFGGLFGGWSSEMLPEHIRVLPNEGIRRSARNSLRVGLVSGLSGSIIAGLILIVPYAGKMSPLLRAHEMKLVIDLLLQGLPFELGVGVVVGLIAGYLLGGIVCIQHVVLRVFLCHVGSIPPNYARFLDYTTEHILLRKVGGGYIFVHRLLLEYFASLGSTPMPDETLAQK